MDHNALSRLRQVLTSKLSDNLLANLTLHKLGVIHYLINQYNQFSR